MSGWEQRSDAHDQEDDGGNTCNGNSQELLSEIEPHYGAGQSFVGLTGSRLEAMSGETDGIGWACGDRLEPISASLTGHRD